MKEQHNQMNNRRFIQDTTTSPPDTDGEFMADVVLGESDNEEEAAGEIIDLGSPVAVEIETIQESSPAKLSRSDKIKYWLPILAILISIGIIVILSLLITKNLTDKDNDPAYRVEIYYGGRSCRFNHIHPDVPVNMGGFCHADDLKIGQVKEDSTTNFIVKLESIVNQTATVQVAFEMDEFKEYCNSIWTVTAVVDSNEYGDFSLSKTCQDPRLGEVSRIDHHVSVKVTEM